MYVWFVSGDDPPGNGGIFQTKDGGRNWTAIDVGGIENCRDSSGCGTEQGDYNLALAAIPNGNTATDLYAGAVNIYRCRINSANPTCTSQPFVNLTHAYGCEPTGSFSKVHPNQHAFDFVQNNPSVIYFANDGGLYRTTDALGLHSVSAACPASAPNQPLFPFENLNGTLGSLTQFEWFSQDPMDEFTLLGTTRFGIVAIDPGDSGLNGLMWRTLLPGNGGSSAVSMSSPSQWFAARAGVSVQRCSVGKACTAEKFSAFNPNLVASDESAFHMPYLVDPQDAGKLLLGTCRVWRITTDGTSSAQLSYKLGGGVENVPCSRSNSMVTSLAVGGPVGTYGSKAIYAGTESGEVFATQDAGAGPTAWNQVSLNPGFANSQHYSISSIAVDSRDSTGNTAYATIRRFSASRVFRTTTGGANWTDITGTLPNSSVNAVLVNPADGSIYVGTDTGVFATPITKGQNTVWTELGPTSGSGMLPNVAVTHLAIFSRQGGIALLRASTYGRGLWEIPLASNQRADDYGISVSNPALLSFPGHTVTFSGLVSAFGAYNSSIELNCDVNSGRLPQTCSAYPASLNPANTGSFSVNATDPDIGDFAFRIQATGTDASALVRTESLGLRVIDFSLDTPQPSSVAGVQRGGEVSIKVPVTSKGSFDQPVTVTCDSSALPAGWTCTSSTVTPNRGGSVPADVRITTSARTEPGTYTVPIFGTWTGAQGLIRTWTQSFPLSVIAQPSFTLSVGSLSPSRAKVSEALTSSIMVTPLDGYTGTVNLSCKGNLGVAQDACSFSPPAVTLSEVPATSTLTVSTTGGIAGNARVNVDAREGTLTRSNELSFTLADYSVSSMSQPNNASSGGTVSFNFVLTASPDYNGQVAYTCDPAQFSMPIDCVFNPGSPVALTSGATRTVNVSVAVPLTETSGSRVITLKTLDQNLPTLQHTQTTGSFQISSQPDFGLRFAGANSATLNAGQSSTATLSISAQGSFNSLVAFTVSGCPSNATCTVAPASVTPTTSNPASAALSVATLAPSTATLRPPRLQKFVAAWLWMPLGIPGFFLIRIRRNGRWPAYFTISALFLVMVACGGGAGGGKDAPPIVRPGTPAGTYTIVVTGTGGTIVKSANFTLTVQ
jgi:hypothetical protein